jgi:CCDC81-like HU domain protein/sporulation related protein
MKYTISKYISELIYLYDCVIIPGLGGFITNYKASQIDYSKSIIQPPTKEILFNHNLKHNDGLLINYIPDRTNQSFIQVSEIVETFVKDVLFDLTQGKKVEFENVGSFYYDRKSNIIFEPTYVSNYLSEAYGFAAIDLPSSLQQRGENTQTIYMDTSNRRKIIIRAAVISVPIILAISMLPFKSKIFKDHNLSFSTLNPIENVVEQESISNEETVVDTVKMDEAISDMTKPENALFYSEENEDKKEVLKRATGTYFLIAGSFKDTNNAAILRDQLREEGYNNSDIIESNNQMFRVTFDVYEDKFIALQELTKIRKEKNDQSVWLYTKKGD